MTLNETDGLYRLLEGFLQEIGVTQEDFAEECQKALAKGSDTVFVYHQIMAVEDFVSFKKVCTCSRCILGRDARLSTEFAQKLPYSQYHRL